MARTERRRPDHGDALDRLMDLSLRMADRMDEGMAAGGLTRARAGVIWELHRRGPIVQRDLAHTLGVTPRNVTGLIDALEANGFVIRRPHPTDRRATVVTLTPAGTSAASAIETERIRFANSLFDHVGDTALIGFSRVLDQLLDAVAHGQNTGEPLNTSGARSASTAAVDRDH